MAEELIKPENKIRISNEAIGRYQDALSGQNVELLEILARNLVDRQIQAIPALRPKEDSPKAGDDLYDSLISGQSPIDVSGPARPRSPLDIINLLAVDEKGQPFEEGSVLGGFMSRIIPSSVGAGAGAAAFKATRDRDWETDL